jgi:hypothetical protein
MEGCSKETSEETSHRGLNAPEAGLVVRRRDSASVLLRAIVIVFETGVGHSEAVTVAGLA